MSENAFSA